MEADPAISIFDISKYIGMEYYAADSAGRMAPMLRGWAHAAQTEGQHDAYLRHALMHEELARKYRLADRLMEEIKQALLEEDACPSS
jgi:hypothetical protein